MKIDTLSQLVRESRYPFDEAAIADAILARIMIPEVAPPLRRSSRAVSRARAVRSFHPSRQASSFRLARPRRRMLGPATRLA
jgi:hypothetical protein